MKCAAHFTHHVVVVVVVVDLYFKYLEISYSHDKNVKVSDMYLPLYTYMKINFWMAYKGL